MRDDLKRITEKVNEEADRRATLQAVAEMQRTIRLDHDRIDSQSRMLSAKVANDILSSEELKAFLEYQAAVAKNGPLPPYVTELDEILKLIEPLAGPFDFNRLESHLRKYLPTSCLPFEEMLLPQFHEAVKQALPQLLADKFGSNSDIRRLLRASVLELEAQLKNLQRLLTAGRCDTESVEQGFGNTSRRLRIVLRHAVRYGLVSGWRDEQDVIDAVGSTRNGKRQSVDLVTRTAWDLAVELVVKPRLRKEHQRLFDSLPDLRSYKVNSAGRAVGENGRPVVWTFREDGSLIADRPLSAHDSGLSTALDVVQSNIHEHIAICRALFDELSGETNVGTGADKGKADLPPQIECLRPSLRIAFLQHQQAVEALGDNATLAELWEHLRENVIDDEDELAELGNWKDYVRAARRQLGLSQSSNSPRSGRKGRSIVNRRDL